MRAAIVIAACLAVASGNISNCQQIAHQAFVKLAISLPCFQAISYDSSKNRDIKANPPLARASDLTITPPARTFSKKALSTPLARGGGRIVGGTDAYPGEFPHQV